MAQLFLAYFYSSCPSLVPLDITKCGANDPDSMLEKLGYKKQPNGNPEGMERFLKRMGGIATLFAAFCVVKVPVGPNQTRTFHIALLWKLLVRLIRMEPFPDLTVMIICEILKVSAKLMFEVYGKNFEKMARLLRDSYLVKLERSDEKKSQSYAALRQFVNTEIAAICNWPIKN